MKKLTLMAFALGMLAFTACSEKKAAAPAEAAAPVEEAKVEETKAEEVKEEKTEE